MRRILRSIKSNKSFQRLVGWSGIIAAVAGVLSIPQVQDWIHKPNALLQSPSPKVPKSVRWSSIGDNNFDSIQTLLNDLSSTEQKSEKALRPILSNLGNEAVFWNLDEPDEIQVAILELRRFYEILVAYAPQFNSRPGLSNTVMFAAMRANAIAQLMVGRFSKSFSETELRTVPETVEAYSAFFKKYSPGAVGISYPEGHEKLPSGELFEHAKNRGLQEMRKYLVKAGLSTSAKPPQPI